MKKWHDSGDAYRFTDRRLSTRGQGGGAHPQRDGLKISRDEVTTKDIEFASGTIAVTSEASGAMIILDDVP